MVFLANKLTLKSDKVCFTFEAEDCSKVIVMFFKLGPFPLGCFFSRAGFLDVYYP